MARMNVSLPDGLHQKVSELKDAGIDINVSAVFQNALERKVREMTMLRELATDMGRIEVDMYDKSDDRRWTKAFEGKWLIHPDEDIRSGQPDADAGMAYGVALTKRGNIAMYAYHVNSGETSFEVYSSLDQAEIDDWPEDIVGMARAELTGESWVEELDI